MFSAMSVWAETEDKVVRFDSKVHDFGDILISEGPLSCSFSFTNISSAPIVVHTVTSSCGCTTPDWTKEPVQPGRSGVVKATFANDQGAAAFDKTLTVYISGIDRPVILRLRGESHESRKDLEELYSVKAGPVGLKRDLLSLNYVDQGASKEDNVQIANLTSAPVSLEAVELDEGLEVSFSPSTLPARSVGRMTFRLDLSKASQKRWGQQSFGFKIKASGKVQEHVFKVQAMIKENFSSMDKASKLRAPKIDLDKSYFEFGEIRRGDVVEASFTLKNRGKEPLIIHAVDCKAPGTKVLASFPLTVAPDSQTVLKVRFDSSKAAAGEALRVLAAVTNAPDKPVLNLFMTGIILE